MGSRAFEYHHTVSFEETNLIGNVYYVNHLRWQGRCREMFLAEHSPDTLNLLKNDLALATTRCSCSYFAELYPFDKVVIRMRLADISQNRLTLSFEYFRLSGSSEELVASGEQEIASMSRHAGEQKPTPLPGELVEALKPYQ